MVDTEPLATTKNVLHPRQVVEMREVKAQQEAMLTGPAHIRSQITDPQALANSIRHLDDVLAKEAPQPIPAARMDEAVKLEASLREAWLDGMPTQAEMRRNPPGAVDLNRAWDKRAKISVLTWKHIRRRLHASGISDFGLADEADVSNIEKFRPRSRPGELGLSPAQIEGKVIALPPAGSGQAVVFSDEDLAALKGVDPEIAAAVGLLPNVARRQILDIIRGNGPPPKDQEGFGLGAPEPASAPKETAEKLPHIKVLRAECKALKINSWGMSKQDMYEAVAEKRVKAHED